eukprot:3221116-Pleurochrysis_carterae.AAC.1
MIPTLCGRALSADLKATAAIAPHPHLRMLMPCVWKTSNPSFALSVARAHLLISPPSCLPPPHFQTLPTPLPPCPCP